MLSFFMSSANNIRVGLLQEKSFFLGRREGPGIAGARLTVTIPPRVLSYSELQKSLLHQEQKKVIFAILKASKREFLKSEATLFGKARF